MSFGRNIAELRTQKGINKKTLATAIGVSNGTISNWESGRFSSADATILSRVANYFGVTIEFILFGTDDRWAVKDSVLSNDYKVPLIDKTNAEEGYNDFDSGSYVFARPGTGAINGFAYVETSSGMQPLVNRGDVVFINKEPVVDWESGLKLFSTKDGVFLGRVSMSPSGMSLEFDNCSSSWDCIDIEEKDYQGTLVDLIPSFLVAV